MEKELKLSSKLSFRGWPQSCVSQLLKLETDNEELLLEVRILRDAIRRCVGERNTTIKTDSGSPGNDPQPFD